jgi:hypothetical protein
MILRESVEVRASPRAIFDFFEHIDRHYLDWHPDHKLFRWVSGEGLRVGNQFHFEEVIAGKLLRKTVTFTRIDPGRHIEFEPNFWLMRAVLPRIFFHLTPLPDGAQRVTQEIHLRVGPLGARLNRREFDAVREHMRVEGANVKRIVEAG